MEIWRILKIPGVCTVRVSFWVMKLIISIFQLI